MIEVEKLINFFPPEDFAEFIKKRENKKVNLYFDLKNIMVSMFVDDIISEIVAVSEENNRMDSRIFQSVLWYASWWLDFLSDTGKEVNIYFCTDDGTSEYHENINKNYKIDRRIGSMDLPSYYEGIQMIRRENFSLAERVINKIPRMYFINTKFLESDFIPYYLITRKFKDQDIDHVFCSSDKDLYQNLLLPNTFMINRNKNGGLVVEKSNIISRFLKIHNLSPANQIKKMELIKKVNPEYFPVLLSLTGDKSDSVEGVPSIGPGRAVDLFSNGKIVSTHVGPMKELYDRVYSGGNVFINEAKPAELSNKYLRLCLEHNETVTNSFRLVSFELLCRWLEEGNKLSKHKKVEYINEVLSKDEKGQIRNHGVLLESLKKMPDYELKDVIVENLF